MTTAVQSSELVFEFASNGMDEINQVSIALEKAHFKLLRLSVALMHDWACRLHFLFDLKTFGPASDDPSFSGRCTVCDLVDKCKTFHSRANKTCVNSMVTGVGLAVAQSL